MARTSDLDEPSRQPAVLGTREGACSCQGLCCHFSAGQAPEHSHESPEVTALAGAGCLPSSPLPPLSSAPSPLPPSASAPAKTWRHISHLPKSKSWTGWGRKWNSLQKGNMENFRSSSLPCPPVNASIPRMRKAEIIIPKKVNCWCQLLLEKESTATMASQRG